MQLLESNIQDYKWGDSSFLALLQGRKPGRKFEAELWMSAHPKSPSKILNSDETLKDVISRDPERTLGPRAADFHNELPYIMKVLAIGRPLSLQVHPSEAQAEAGYEREAQLTAPLDDTQRSYLSPRGKEEIVCALTRFDARFGFRDMVKIKKILSISKDTEFTELLDLFSIEKTEEENIRDIVSTILNYGSEQIEKMVLPAIDFLLSGDGLEIGISDEEMESFAPVIQMYPHDPCVIISLLMNRIILEPGEALYVPPGTPHLYIKGNAVEVTSNSDNVLRCGLTSKDVNQKEFLSVAQFTSQTPTIQKPESSNHSYESPTEFSLSRLVVTTEWETTVTGPEVLISTEGSFTIRDLKGEAIHVDQGTAVWIPFSDGGYSISGQALIFRCSAM